MARFRIPCCRYILRFIGIAVLTLWIPHSSKKAFSADVADIKAAWSRRWTATDSFQYEYSLTRFMNITPIMGQANNPLAASPEKASEKSTQMAFRGELLFAISGERIAFRQDVERWDAQRNERVTQLIESAFDGRCNKSVNHGGQLAMGKWIISREPEPTFTIHTDHIPIWLAHDPLSVINRLGYSTNNMRLTRIEVDVDGVSCAELVIPRRATGWRAVIYVDPSRGFLPKRFLQELHMQRRSDLLIEYVPDEKVDWAISGWSVRRFDADGEMIRAITSEVTEFISNKQFNDRDFTVRFPFGAHIDKRDGMSTQCYKVANGGSLTPMAESDFGAINNDQ